LTCDSNQPAAQFQTGTMFGKFWGAEISYSNASRVGRLAGDAPAQGLTFSLLGRTQLTPSIGLYGKAGTTYGRGDPAAPALGMAGRNGFGLAFGAGLSYDVTPRLSATLQWDSVDVPMTIGGRDPVRSTSLGLKYRY
jgi:opacity protein-like surface antigen